MIGELRTKSQITLPKEIVTKLGLERGDHLEIYEKNGIIYLVPVTIYPKKYIEELCEEIETLKTNVRDGKQPVFDSVDSLMKKLG